MFSQACVKNSVQGGGRHPPWADPPPPGRHFPGQALPRADGQQAGGMQPLECNLVKTKSTLTKHAVVTLIVVTSMES